MKDHAKLIAVRITLNALKAGLSLDEAHQIAQDSMSRKIDKGLLKSALEQSGWQDSPSDFFGESLNLGDADEPLDLAELPA